MREGEHPATFFFFFLYFIFFLIFLFFFFQPPFILPILKSSTSFTCGRGWGSGMASLTQWIRVWANSARQWRTGKPGMLQFLGLQSFGHYTTEQQVLVGFPGGASGKESACQCRRFKRKGFDPGLGRSRREGHGSPLPYARLENPMDRGAWRATVHGVSRVGHDLRTLHACTTLTGSKNHRAFKN